MLLHEFDEGRVAVINPEDCVQPVENFPQVVVSCFAYTTFERLVEQTDAKKIDSVHIAHMDAPVYVAEYKGKRIALAQSCVGAPACCAILEDLFVKGAQKAVIFGTCGVLDKRISDCSVIIPDIAMRDEGTSYHYAPPSDEIRVNGKYGEAFKVLLEELGCSYTVGKVWTTDAAYRETREKVNRRKESGCVCVDMECSAVAALCDFRGKDALHFFYAADNLDGEKWDKRSLGNHENLQAKDRIALLAMEMAARMTET